ncbi:MAG: hypothetical protein S4CHLAM2_02690 [Chlamydiales bacterium]|nr:hypothetical protein [Chlamydiales bacterium]
MATGPLRGDDDFLSAKRVRKINCSQPKIHSQKKALLTEVKRAETPRKRGGGFLSLGELEALTRLLAAVFLTLFLTRITGQVSLYLQLVTMVGVLLH